MEFSFKVSDILSIDKENFSFLDGAKFAARTKTPQTSSLLATYNTKSRADPSVEAMREILDKMGEASAKAQGLKQPITSYIKFATNKDHRIYMKADSKKVYGFIKMGHKNLFYRDHFGNVKEIQPLCVLDFYVHESAQRHGIGKQIFEKMLECEGVNPKRLAYDRPSNKLIPFLKKHYGLVSYVPQNNNFVIFNAYWDSPSTDSTKPARPVSSNEERKENYLSRQVPERKEGVSDLLRLDDQNTIKRDVSPLATRYAANKGSQSVRPGGAYVKEDFSSASINDKLKETENSILDSQAKIKQLNEERAQLAAPHERRHKEYHNKAPWASHTDHYNTYKTSNSYGSHYNQKQPMGRHDD